MSELIEVKVEIRKRDEIGKESGPVIRVLCTKFRPCSSRMELATILSLIAEAQQAESSYQALKLRFEKMVNGDAEADLKKAVKGYKALSELDQAHFERCLSVFNRMAGELQNLAESGDPISKYEMQDVGVAAALYYEKQTMTRKQEGNSDGGSSS